MRPAATRGAVSLGCAVSLLYLSGFFCRLQIPFPVQDRVSTADASVLSPGILVCQKEKDQNASGRVRNDCVPTKLSRRCSFVSLLLVSQ